MPQGGDLVAVPVDADAVAGALAVVVADLDAGPQVVARDDDVLVVLVVVGEYDGGAFAAAWTGGAAAWGVPGAGR